MKTQYILKNENGTFYYLDKTMTKPHREDGPAVEYANGTKYWYLNGEGLSKEEWEKRVMKKTININGKAFTIEELNNLIASVK